MSKKPIQLDANGKRKFGIRDKLAYAAGDLGCNLSFGLKSTVQTFWLVFMMMETGLFSLLLLLVQAWDAVNDPMWGALVAKKKPNKLRWPGKVFTYFTNAYNIYTNVAKSSTFEKLNRRLNRVYEVQ